MKGKTLYLLILFALLTPVVVTVIAIAHMGRTSRRNQEAAAQQAYAEARCTRRPPTMSKEFEDSISSLPRPLVDEWYSKVWKAIGRLQDADNRRRALDVELLEDLNEKRRKKGEPTVKRFAADGMHSLGLPPERLAVITRKYQNQATTHRAGTDWLEQAEKTVKAEVIRYDTKRVAEEWERCRVQLVKSDCRIGVTRYHITVSKQHKEACTRLIAELDGLKWSLRDNRQDHYIRGVQKLEALATEIAILDAGTEPYATFLKSYTVLEKDIWWCIEQLNTRKATDTLRRLQQAWQKLNFAWPDCGPETAHQEVERIGRQTAADIEEVKKSTQVLVAA